MKIFSAAQVREADRYTIKREPISSRDLMIRASEAFVKKFLEIYLNKRPVKIICGTGNNGGDGLVIARLLRQEFWDVSVYVAGNYYNGSRDFLYNLKRVESSFSTNTLFLEINSLEEFPEINDGDIVIDAIFGSGLSKPVTGVIADLIEYLNEQPVSKVSVDIASGLGVDETFDGAVIQPDHTISFQFPKLAFFSSANEKYVGKWHVVDIGLHKKFIKKEETNFYLTAHEDIQELIPYRQKFTYKNKVGRLRIVAGSKGKMGAALLCARAAFKAGAGIMDVHVPSCGTLIFQVSLPEAMVEEDAQETYTSDIPFDNDALAIGPGIGQNMDTANAFRKFLEERDDPIVIDADAINMISKNEAWIDLVPKESILTPHEGEFKRLVGKWEGDFERFEKLSAFCSKNELNVVLKGPNSAVCDTKGQIHFNSTGNPVLATAGSGDVLTGVIASFLAQGLLPFDALKLGVYIHGLAGDIVAEEASKFGVMASDIVEAIPKSLSKASALGENN